MCIDDIILLYYNKKKEKGYYYYYINKYIFMAKIHRLWKVTFCAKAKRSAGNPEPSRPTIK